MLKKSKKRFAKGGWKSNVSNFHNAGKNNFGKGKKCGIHLMIYFALLLCPDACYFAIYIQVCTFLSKHCYFYWELDKYFSKATFFHDTFSDTE